MTALPALAAAALALPPVASAQVTVSGFPVSTSLAVVPSGGNSQTEPALSPAPDGSNAEWFVVNARNQNVLSIAPGGRQTRIADGLAADAGSSVTFASVSADGYDWVLDNDQGPGNVLYAVGAPGAPSPGLNLVARFGDYGQDMTLGSDGALYISDNDGIIRCRITPEPSANCSTVALQPPFYTGAGAFAIDGGGNAVWFTDGNGALGAYSAAGFNGPFPAPGDTPASSDPGTIVTAANGYVYMAGGGLPGSGENTQILDFSPGDPEQVAVAASGLGNVVAMTVGPDGNVWFLDAGGGGSVGELDLGTGAVTQYALPQGLWLPQSGWRIASGPAVADANGNGEVFFTATTAAGGQGNAAIGEVSGIPFPATPGVIAFKPAVKVSRHRRANLTLICSGQGDSACAGRIGFSVAAKLRVRVRVRGSKKGGGARYRTLPETRRLWLGHIDYNVRGGQRARATLKLTRHAYRVLEAVRGHSWTANVTSTTTVGTVSGTRLTMTGP